MHIDLKDMDFSIVTTDAHIKHFSHYLGKWLVLYFYPKDATSGCTVEACDFNQHYAAFQRLNAEVLGVSRDTLNSHLKFKQQQDLKFELLSDVSQQLCQLFDVMKEKSMYGKKYWGIERSTFVMNPQGQLVHSWRQVKVSGHVLEVLDTVKHLQEREQ